MNMPFEMSVGSVGVKTTNNRGFTPEEVAELCVDRLMVVSNDAPPAIRDQALAHKERMKSVIAVYMKQAIQSDRTTIYNAISDAGHPELATLIRRL
jgi:DNA-binding phage protein|tara:strand:+ start:166 stop:453 length:288 start_codon:yes stop_codon:yes gene_type:complete